MLNTFLKTNAQLTANVNEKDLLYVKIIMSHSVPLNFTHSMGMTLNCELIHGQFSELLRCVVNENTVIAFSLAMDTAKLSLESSFLMLSP